MRYRGKFMLTVVLFFMAFAINASATQRLVLAEMFTNTS